jgi:hypothetical protein
MGGHFAALSQVRVLTSWVGMSATVVIKVLQVVVESRRPAGSATGTV